MNSKITNPSTGLVLANTGSYPRIGDSRELQNLRRTIAAADRGERTVADLAEAENEMTRRAIQEQMQAGIELLTDGQIRWDDPISHLPSRLEGVKINGLLRFFDTNFYFRQPVLIARPKPRPGGAPVLVQEYKFACNALGLLPTSREKAGRLAVKPVLTGPYTLAKFSLVEDSTMATLEARAQAYAEALAIELRALIEAGAKFIQIDEPAILKFPEDWPVFEQALRVLLPPKQETARMRRSVILALYVYFRDPAPLYDKLVRLPIDVLGLDFTYSPNLVETLAAAGSPIPLGLGLVDGRNTKLEDPATVAQQVEKILPKITGERAYLGPSCGLEYLTRDRAYAKLELVSKIRAALQAT